MIMIRFCSWHPAYFHRSKILGLRLGGTRWSRLGLERTDGICGDCARRFRAGEVVVDDPEMAVRRRRLRELGLRLR